MSTQVQYRRGTNGENASFTGALGEITVDTTYLTLRVHDGTTVGGSNIATKLYVDNLIANISTTSIENGNSQVAVIADGGNIRANVAGATVAVWSTVGANVTGNVYASGNVSGTYILGNGSQLSGLADPTFIENGTSNVVCLSSDGNIEATVDGNLIQTWHDTGSEFARPVEITGNITASNVLTGGFVSATGNITGGNLVSNASITGTLITAAQTNITSVGTLTSLAVSGNITGGNIISSGIVGGTEFVKSGSNGVGNIGQVDNQFERVFAAANYALYADLAEMYEADADYVPGTVVSFGGSKEITQSSQDHDVRVAGVISTNPSFLMNSAHQGQYVLPLTMCGRVPTLVVGPVRKGDMMVSAGNGRARSESAPAMGAVIGKALEDFDQDFGTIEIVVGRI